MKYRDIVAVDDVSFEVRENEIFGMIGPNGAGKTSNYSSGMQVRLAFSIAIKASGDILVLDEVLAVGDEAFQRKCFAYFAQLKKDKKTVVLVSAEIGRASCRERV